MKILVRKVRLIVEGVLYSRASYIYKEINFTNKSKDFSYKIIKYIKIKNKKSIKFNLANLI